jgi:hypothetical protein
MPKAFGTKTICPNDGSRNFENTRNPGKKVGSPAYEPKRPPGRFCRISMCFQIHRLSGTAFGRARALSLTNIFRWVKYFFGLMFKFQDMLTFIPGY